MSAANPPVSPLTRELACLALGHADADRTACALTDEELVRELVETVQQLRREVDDLLTVVGTAP